MTQEVLECLQGEQGGEALRPDEAGPYPPAGEAEDAGLKTPAPGETDTASAPAGNLPPKGKAEERNRDKSAESAGMPDAGSLREHFAALREQAARIPGFDLREALRDPAFVRLTAPGVGVSVADAWYALHREESERRQKEESRSALARAAAASARRPREGGGTGAALIAADYRSMSREERLRVKKRIFEAGARGEKVYP